MSARFSGHLPERMLGTLRPGSEGDLYLCHPSQELPLSWCIIEPLNQLPRLLSPPSFLSRVETVPTPPKIQTRQTDKGVKVTLLFFSYLHLRCYGIAVHNTGQQQKGRRWLCGHLCQPLTVYCVKLVIISSVKACPVHVACLGRGIRQDLEAGCLCQGGKSLLWWGGKHYGMLYWHRLLWHILKCPDKFAGCR